jgi:outer membrane protein OmpA-like peptidoglycan-associated protein
MRTHLPYVILPALAIAPVVQANEGRENTEPAEAEASRDDGLDEEVFFAFDSSALTEAAKSELAAVASRADEQPNAKVVLAGHADATGTAAYNAGLSARRAEAVRDHLVAEGVDRDRIVLGVFGEDAPRRASRLEDRRVSVELSREPLYVIVDQTLADGIALIWGEPVTTAEIEGPLPEQVAER